ncbi:hypothetical protein CFBP5507_06000 [Agrobacterium salinitolerans]|uniref:Uncharacterized protein n=1 Tax=Agrobacterium salinitolerans TaxID=1183413 RepID=A0A4Z1R646_9HYPH|nr:hypothetical protein [Agrobacterium salinitolerans]UYZ08552.1 hypothetical protein CFBP5507_06000 [Agrobacterium salinitolerans]
MATKKAPPAIEPVSTYRVELKRSIQIGRSWVHPGPNVKLRGDILDAKIQEDAEAIGAYEPVEIPGE